ncbi:hypothetical protein [Alkalihalobacillus pseudalcaliphilus]|uniref:hypothetical protein n=1 Tax=Alkalihalobacillus pseudalcaliphilus TaxID=79884 RepID=UPI00064D9DF3|nr:hypothetical protein [Alkalihalobacillus pseudalcaliphilus]KMK75425.1 hypothetical protein AB990_08905 [Alkalihalobacillus pseudalcaliphilus]
MTDAYIENPPEWLPKVIEGYERDLVEIDRDLARLPAKEAELLREKAEVMNALISLKAYVKEDAE